MKRLGAFPLVAMLRRLLPPLVVSFAALFACALVYWRIEPNTPALTDALWLTFATASTVGYGDVVPSTHASKALSVIVLLLGFTVLSLVTAAVATIWVESREREIEREILRDLHAQVRELRAELRAAGRARGPAPTAPAGATATRADRRRSASRPARSRAR